MGGERVSMKADKIPMLDASNCSELCFKLLQVVCIMCVNTFNCHWSGILQNTLVHVT